MVSVMKSPNMMSTTGRRPVMAAPTPSPVRPASEMGVSITRSLPNSSTRPVSTLKGVPASATSSPRTKTRGSRRISSANASRIASAKVRARPGASGIDMLMHLAHVRVRSVHRELRRRFDRGLHVHLNPVQHGLLGELLTQQPVGQRLEGVLCRRPMSFFVFGPVIRAVNVINMAKKRDGGASDALRLPPFGSTDLQFLNALMTYIGYAVDNARLLEEAQDSAQRLQGVVDDLKATQAQLVRGETLRAMGQLSSGMAHHLNNLFAVILGRVELLMGKVQEGSVRRSLEIIQRTAQDGAEVVRRVQRFSRVQPVSDAVAVDLNQLVHEVVELTRPRWQDEAQLRGSRIEVAVEAGVIGAAAGEPAPLREVLMNLLLNAADAITQGGRITLRTWARDDRVYCSVTDTGAGMPEEVRRRALEPFFTTKGPKSTGLGLSVAYGTVQRYGGTLTVESTEGQGTTVEVSLPTASAATAISKTTT